MKIIPVLLATMFAFVSAHAVADHCSLSLTKKDKKFLAKAQEGTHEFDGRHCGQWDGKAESNLLLHTMDGETHYRYSALLSWGRADEDGVVRWEVDGKEFNYSAGGDWRIYVTVEEDGLHALIRDDNGVERATAIFTNHNDAE